MKRNKKGTRIRRAVFFANWLFLYYNSVYLIPGCISVLIIQCYTYNKNIIFQV